MLAHQCISQEVRANNYTIIGLQVGDSLQSMLTAEGGIFVNVLQGQRSDSVLPAKCFAVVNDDEHMLLLIREVRSNNWYGETFPVQAEDDNGCIRPRKRGKTS